MNQTLKGRKEMKFQNTSWVIIAVKLMIAMTCWHSSLSPNVQGEQVLNAQVDIKIRQRKESMRCAGRHLEVIHPLLLLDLVFRQQTHDLQRPKVALMHSWVFLGYARHGWLPRGFCNCTFCFSAFQSILNKLSNSFLSVIHIINIHLCVRVYICVSVYVCAFVKGIISLFFRACTTSHFQNTFSVCK